MASNPTRLRRLLATAAIVGGASIGAAGIAAAATTSSSVHAGSQPLAGSLHPGEPRGDGNPADTLHGPGETLLTGADLASATATASAAIPGATVIRAETNSSGASAYEVHLKRADGTDVTVLLDASFTVTGTTSGFGPGPQGQQPTAGDHGAPDHAGATDTPDAVTDN
jgi:hypothetical protein